MALLVREMEFRKLELRQIAATLVGATVGIAIAIVDRSAWAIVGQLLAEACDLDGPPLGADAVAPVVHVLDGQPAPPRRLRRQRLRGEHDLAGRPDA